jgi:hypothetical protein
VVYGQVHSPDLIPCDFYLWGNLKDKDYRKNSKTKEQLKEKHKMRSFESSSRRTSSGAFWTI